MSVCCPAARNQERPSSREWTADNPQVNWTFCSFPGLHRISFARASEESFKAVVFDAPGAPQRFWWARGAAISWVDRPVGVPSCSAAPPCAAPPRPACGRVLGSANLENKPVRSPTRKQSQVSIWFPRKRFAERASTGHPLGSLSAGGFSRLLWWRRPNSSCRAWLSGRRSLTD